MSIRKTLNDLAEGDKAEFETPFSGARVAVHDDGSAIYPIKVDIDKMWMGSVDLRKTAKLLNKLAKMLEEEGRGDATE